MGEREGERAGEVSFSLVYFPFNIPSSSLAHLHARVLDIKGESAEAGDDLSVEEGLEAHGRLAILPRGKVRGQLP